MGDFIENLVNETYEEIKELMDYQFRKIENIPPKELLEIVKELDGHERAEFFEGFVKTLQVSITANTELKDFKLKMYISDEDSNTLDFEATYIDEETSEDGLEKWVDIDFTPKESGG